MLQTTKPLCVLAACLILAAGLTGCGGALSGKTAKPTDRAADVTTQIRVGNNVPTGYVVYFQMPLSSVTLTSDKGTKVELLPESMQVEHSHLVVSEDVLTDLTLPQGTYTQADIVLDNAHLTYADYYAQIVETDLPAPSSVHLTLNTPIVIGADSTAISIGLDLAQTLSIDAIQDTATLNTPAFTLTQETIPAPGAAAQIRADLAAPRDKSGAQAGTVGNIFGTVKSVSGTYFTVLNASTGSSLAMNTDSGTVFQGATLGTLKGLLVEVETVTQKDGTLLAEEVETLSSGSGAALVGVTTSVANGSSAATTVQTGLGTGVISSVSGKTVNVDLSNVGRYKIDTAGIDMTGLTFTFDQATIVEGQSVDYVSTRGLQPDSQGSAGILLADAVELEQQTITGNIANLGTDSSGRTIFDLLLSSDGSSTLTLLTAGVNQIHVVLQSATVVSAQLTNGSQVNVRGLLFYYVPQSYPGVRPHATPPGMQASYVMVARRIQ